jgi:hypothetical protein
VRAALAIGLAALLVLPSTGSAQMLRWEDAEGTVHFSNAPDAHRSPAEAAADAAVIPDDRAGPPVARAALTRIRFAPGAPIVVSARISDAASPVSLILDTGADRTMVAPQALWRIGISTLNAPRAMIKGVTGLSHGDVVHVSSVQVGEARVGPLPIVAHDADLKHAEGLLGRDFLEHFTVTIDAREQVVTLAPK